MKLHLPKALLAAVLHAGAAVSLTMAMGSYAYAAYTVADGASASVAEILDAGENSAVVSTGGTLSISGASGDTMADLTGGVTFDNGSALELDDGANISAALTINDPENSSISLSIASGATATWGIAQGNKGVTSVTVNEGATFNVTSGESKACVFNNKENSDMTIELKAGSTLTSNNLFGWENQAAGNSARIINVGNGATWSINARTEFYLNKTTINLSGGRLVLNEGVNMMFERRENSINTTAQATKMSVIEGAGHIKSGNNAAENGGYIFNVVRGNFELSGDNTSDLRIDAAIVNGAPNHAVQKTGNGTLELTADSNGFTGGFNLRAGTTKLTGNGTLGYGNRVVVDAPATLEIDHSNAISSNIILDGKLTLKQAMNLTGSLDIHSDATFDFSALQADGNGVTTAFIGNGTVDLNALNMAMATNRVVFNQQAADGSHYIFQAEEGGNAGFFAAQDLLWQNGTTEWNAATTYQGGATRDNAAWVVFDTNAEENVSMTGDLNMFALVKSGATLALNTGAHTYTGVLSLDAGSALKLSGTGLSLTQISGEGNVTLLGDCTLNSGQSTTATGGLTVGDGSGDLVAFTVGTAKDGDVSIESFSSVTLDHGKILYHGSGSNFKNLHVTENGGELYITDMHDVTSHAVNLKGTTTIDGTLTVTTSWKSTVNIESLTGKGHLVFNGGDNSSDTQPSTLKLSSLGNFEGSITVNKKSGANDAMSKAILSLTNTNASGETFHSLTLSSDVKGENTLGGIVEIFNSGMARTTTVESLTVKGLGTLETWKNGSCWNGTININALIGTDAVLNLRSGSQTSARTVFNLGTADSGGAQYTGIINVVNNAVTGSIRSVGLVINNDAIAQGAVINLAESSANGNGNHADLGVNSSNVNVRGVTTTAASDSGAFTSTIVSGSLSANDSAASSDDTVRTLTINTQSGDDFTANAAVKGNLNLAKKGEGKQTFSGDMSAFNQAVSVEAGELAFSNTAVLAMTDLNVKSGATLTISSPVQTAAADSFSGARVGNAATLEGGATINGGLDLTSTSTLTINNVDNSAITLNGALVLPDGTIALAGDILDALSGLAEGGRLDVFSGVSLLTLGSATYTDALEASADTDLSKYFNGVDAGLYQLGYTGAADGGVVFIQSNVPEPATATLSLLALAALAARRRRKA